MERPQPSDNAPRGIPLCGKAWTAYTGCVLLAVVMLIRGVSRAEGEKLLADANGILRGALAG